MTIRAALGFQREIQYPQNEKQKLRAITDILQQILALIAVLGDVPKSVANAVGFPESGRWGHVAVACIVLVALGFVVHAKKGKKGEQTYWSYGCFARALARVLFVFVGAILILTVTGELFSPGKLFGSPIELGREEFHRQVDSKSWVQEAPDKLVLSVHIPADLKGWKGNLEYLLRTRPEDITDCSYRYDKSQTISDQEMPGTGHLYDGRGTYQWIFPSANPSRRWEIVVKLKNPALLATGHRPIAFIAFRRP